jgi:hypothetical protein
MPPDVKIAGPKFFLAASLLRRNDGTLRERILRAHGYIAALHASDFPTPDLAKQFKALLALLTRKGFVSLTVPHLDERELNQVVELFRSISDGLATIAKAR